MEPGTDIPVGILELGPRVWCEALALYSVDCHEGKIPEGARSYRALCQMTREPETYLNRAMRTLGYATQVVEIIPR